jgi:hypothetical protein
LQMTSQNVPYGIWAYLSTFSRVWAFIWKLGFGAGSTLGWKVGSGFASASNKTKDPDPHPHQIKIRIRIHPGPHQSDADPQQWTSTWIRCCGSGSGINILSPQQWR